MKLTEDLINAAIVQFIGRCEIPAWICDETVKKQHSQDVYYTLASIQGAYELGEILKEKMKDASDSAVQEYYP